MYKARSPVEQLAVVTRFIQKANLTHQNKYTYDKIGYTQSSKSITVTCPEHGDFVVIAGDHVRRNGVGCPVCRSLLPRPVGLGRTRTQEQFVEKAQAVHGNKYDYTQTVYQKSAIHVTILCPIHGAFSQTPANHIAGRGCPACHTRTKKVGVVPCQ